MFINITLKEAQNEEIISERYGKKLFATLISW